MTPNIPELTTWHSVLGLLGIIAVANMVLWFVSLTKQVFGRKPTLEEEMNTNAKSLRSEIYQAKNSALKEMGSRYAAIEARTAILEARHEEMQLDRERKWKELQHEISELRETMAFIRGRFEKKDQHDSTR